MQKYPLGSLNKIYSTVIKSPKSSFYRNFYKKHNISIRAIKNTLDFQSLPFLTRENIVSVVPLGRLFVPKGEVTQWNMTSGTTSGGRPLIVPKIDHKVDDEMNNVMADILNKNRVGIVMLLGNLHRMNSIAREWIYHPKLSKIGYIFGDIGDLATAAKLFAAAEAEGIITTPSALSFFMPYLKEVYDLSRVKFISLGGEATSEQRLEFFKDYFPNAYFHFRFGGTENPVSKGFQCAFLSKLPPRYLHPDTDFFLFEVVDEKGNSVKDGEVGELILTTLKKCAFPLLRYKTGDAISWKRKKCGCGRTDVIEVFGRMGYDFVRVFGITIHNQLLEDAVSKAGSDKVEDYQLHIYEVVSQNRLMPKFVLEVSGAKIDDKKLDFLAKKIEKNLYLSSRMTLKELVRNGLFLSLEVKVVNKTISPKKKLKIISHLI